MQIIDVLVVVKHVVVSIVFSKQNAEVVHQPLQIDSRSSCKMASFAENDVDRSLFLSMPTRDF